MVLNAGAAAAKTDEWARYWRAPESQIEAMHARFRRHRYHPHSHDAYSFGVTDIGVQAFRCRGADRASASGMVMAFNPDDPHDGHAGIELGFEYRIAHVGEELVTQVLGDAMGIRAGRPLFREPVVTDARAAEGLRRFFASLFDEDGSRLSRDESLAAAIVAMGRSAGIVTELPVARASEAARVATAVRGYLDERFASDLGAEEMAAAASCSRFAMYRAFSAHYGLSPSDYQRQCRLREARRLLRQGSSLAEAALAVGFADQSHLTRWFVRCFGVTPGAYRRALAD